MGVWRGCHQVFLEGVPIVLGLVLVQLEVCSQVINFFGAIEWVELLKLKHVHKLQHLCGHAVLFSDAVGMVPMEERVQYR